jgi:hypothetical protein
MDDHLASSAAVEPPTLAPTPDPGAEQRERERAKRAEAARIAALVRYLLHDRQAATD